VVNTSFKVSNLEQQGALLNMPHNQQSEHENTYSYVRVQSTPPVFNITPSLLFLKEPSKNPEWKTYQMDGKSWPRQTSVLRMLARFDSFGKFDLIQTV